MTFQPSKQMYSGKIREVTLGSGDKAVTIGGRGVYAFHSFEGHVPNAPRIAMEVWDKDPSEEWAAAAKAPFSDVLADPAAWAKKCVNEYGAEIIVVQTKAPTPTVITASAAEVAATVKKVVDAVDVPVLCGA